MLIFEVRFQRMFGILRDKYLNVQYNTDTTWRQEITNIFNSIHKA